MISRFNSGFKATFLQSSFPSLRLKSATVTKVRSLCSSQSSPFQFGRNPSCLMNHSYSNCLKGALPIVSGLVFSSYLGVHQSVALCAPKDAEKNDPANLPSEVQGYTRKELKEKKPNLFNYLHSENNQEQKTESNADVRTKAGAFQELLEMGEKAIEQVKGKNLCIVLGNEDIEKGQFVSWLNGTDMKLDSKQNPVHQTASPRVVEINNEMVVIMPGAQSSKSDLIPFAHALILERIINAANSASFVFTVGKDLLEPIPINKCETSFFGLEGISNALSSVFSPAPVESDDIKPSRIKEWEKSFNEIIGSLGFIPEEVRDFKLSQGEKSTPDHQHNSPVMVLVNNSDASSMRFPLDSLNHIASTYDPEKSDKLQAIKSFSSLEKKAFSVKVPCLQSDIEMSIDDLNRLKDHLNKTLDDIPENSAPEQFKKRFDEEILPSINYCDRLCDFAADKKMNKATEEYKAVKKRFEEKLSLMISRWVDDVTESNNKLDAHQLSSLIEEIPKKIRRTPFLTHAIVSKLSPLVIPKTSPHVAGCLTTATASLVAFAPFPWVAIPVAIVAGVYLNVTKTDQKILHVFGERSKHYFPILNKWVHEKALLEELSDSYDKILANVFDKETEFREKRDEQRGKVNAILKEIRSVFLKPYLQSNTDYSQRKGEIDVYLIREGYYYKENTSTEVKKRAKNPLTGSEDKSREYFEELDYDLYKRINEFLAEKNDYFDDLNEEDKDLVLSRIKSLKVSMKRLISNQNDFMYYSVLKMQSEISKSRVEQMSQTWVESVKRWIKNTSAEAATAVYKKLPWVKDEPPKETS